jgi:hypothetical protein
MKHMSAPMIRSKTFVRAAGALSLAAAAALGGTGIASAGPSPARSGTEQFYLMTTSGTATTIPVIANGVFTAAGTNHEGNTVDIIRLPHGSFAVNHPGSGGAPKLNPATCFFTINVTGPITIGHGTGAYRGISGSGKAVISIIGILGRTPSGACSFSVKMVAWQQTIRATAHVRL